MFLSSFKKYQENETINLTKQSASTKCYIYVSIFLQVYETVKRKHRRCQRCDEKNIFKKIVSRRYGMREFSYGI